MDWKRQAKLKLPEWCQIMDYIYGPTFEEMRNPDKTRQDIRKKALESELLDPLNLYNITWKDEKNRARHFVMPKELTGVEANIILLIGNRFPTGSHKVGPVYSILMEKELDGEILPGRDVIVCPSTGNYGIGGAWVGPRKGYKSIVILPEEMSRERFEKIRGYGADVIATPGCESNVKEIFDKAKELEKEPRNKILQQFSEFGNYRFHYYVTGGSIVDLFRDKNFGNGKIAAFVSAMGSAGTIAAGDLLKEMFPQMKIVGLEPVQCQTMYNVGFGAHRIEGIGDKHVTWIHNVFNMDYLMCIDDMETLRGLHLIQEGTDIIIEELGVEESVAYSMVGLFGISTICNIYGAIKTAKYLELGADENIVTIATDGFDRYASVIRWLTRREGPMDRNRALRLLDIFSSQKTDYVLEGSPMVRQRWHNQKYFTWVEQQGKTIKELEEQKKPEYWQYQRDKIYEIDEKLIEARGF